MPANKATSGGEASSGLGEDALPVKESRSLQCSLPFLERPTGNVPGIGDASPFPHPCQEHNSRRHAMDGVVLLFYWWEASHRVRVEV